LKKKRVHFVLCLPYTGINHSSAAVELASNFCGTALDPVLYIGQHAQSLPAGLAVVRAFPVELPGRIAYMPWVKKLAQRRIEKRLLAAIDREGPGALVWIWPGVPHALIRKLHALGAILVREMINTHVGTARRILADEAAATGYSLKAPIGVDQQEAEIADLALMRFVVSPSECVDQSLIEWGFPAERIIRSTFGWNPQSLIDQPAVAPVGAKPIALFVGTIGMRKGVHRALAAWQKADTGGSFLLVGDIVPYSVCARSGAHLPVCRFHVRSHTRRGCAAGLFSGGGLRPSDPDRSDGRVALHRERRKRTGCRSV
jgi:glycosyltransferase involved in cell wall biosynthesis